MKHLRRHMKLIALCASCAVIGAAASAIATAGAATGTASHTRARAGARLGLRAIARRSVHGELVVWTRGGFATVTFDRGSIQSVSGQQITIREGTKKATYKTVTLTIPANAIVRDGGRPAALSALTGGERVLVVQGPQRSLVVARSPSASK